MKKLIMALALTALLSLSVFAGDVNSPPAPQPLPESLIVKIVSFLIG